MSCPAAFSAATSLRNLTRYGRNDVDRVVTPPRAATAASSADDPGFDNSGFQMRRTDTKYQYRTDGTLVNQTDLTLRRQTGDLAHVLVAGMELNRSAIQNGLDLGYLDATTLMEWLIRRGTPQRTAHHLAVQPG